MAPSFSFGLIGIVLVGAVLVLLLGGLIVGAMVMMEKSKDPARASREGAPPLPTEPRMNSCPACGAALPLQVETCPVCGKALTPAGTPKPPEETDAHGDPKQGHDSGIRGA